MRFLILRLSHFFIMAFLFPLICFAQAKTDVDIDVHVSQLITASDSARKDNRIISLSYIEEALKLAENISDTTRLKLYGTAGIVYKDWGSFSIALGYFFKELALQDQIDESKSFLIYNNIGGCYYQLGETHKTREFLEKAVRDFRSSKSEYHPKDIETYTIYNNLALLEVEDGNFAKGLEMLNEFKRKNEELKDTTNILLALQNLSDLHIKLNNNDTAIQALQRALKMAENRGNPYDIAYQSNSLGEVYSQVLKKTDSALLYTKRAFDLSERHSFTDINLIASQNLVTLYKNEGDFKKALFYFQIERGLSEDIINTENKKRLEELEMRYHHNILEIENKERQKKRELILGLSIGLLILFSVSAVLAVKLLRIKLDKKVSENSILETKLDNSNKILANSALQMMQASEIIDTTSKKLKDMKVNSGEIDSNQLSKIINGLKNRNTAFNKREIEKLIVDVDGDFYKNLLSEYPKITKNEIRLCAFLKLNLDTKEISSITHQSPQSIVVARYRLRKKLKIDKEQSLMSYLVQFD